MGKKSRRQREPGGAAAGFLKPHKRFEKDHWRHIDGSEITSEQELKLYCAMGWKGMRDDVKTNGDTDPGKREYLSLVCLRKVTTKGMNNAIHAWKRWPQMQTHWPRIRRRICDQCGRQVALSEPRFMVCGGCGVARYCSEACQIASWGHHQKCCVKLARYATRQKKIAASDPVV